MYLCVDRNLTGHKLAQDPQVLGDWITPFFLQNYGGNLYRSCQLLFSTAKIKQNKTKQTNF